jgi:hypothetical protein
MKSREIEESEMEENKINIFLLTFCYVCGLCCFLLFATADDDDNDDDISKYVM